MKKEEKKTDDPAKKPDQERTPLNKASQAQIDAIATFVALANDQVAVSEVALTAIEAVLGK